MGYILHGVGKFNLFFLVFTSRDYTGLVHEDCIAKMRLMSLVDLGSNQSGQIPHSLIRDTLQVILTLFL